MAEVTRKVAVYPGCSLEGSSSAFQASLVAVLKKLGVGWEELQDWTCCGASSAHAVDHRLHQGLTLRNLSLAEQQGYTELLAPCAACFHRLASAQNEFVKNPDSAQGLDVVYRGGVTVRNVLDYIVRDLGLDAVRKQVVRRLDCKVACYYGCLNTRIPRAAVSDDREYPMAMDNLVSVLGGDPIPWSYKTECCGASLFATSGNVSGKLVGKILQDAEARGADCVVVACPMCHNNLDTKQAAIRETYGIQRPLPVLFVSQLMGLAFGLPEAVLQLNDNFTPVGALASHG